VAPKDLREPFARLFTQGMVRLGGTRMSKSKGNLVSPQEAFDTVGADALRLGHLFVAPPTDDVDWEGVSLEGTSRFLARLWRLAAPAGTAVADADAGDPAAEVDRAAHRLIARVSEDYGRWSFNTAVAACMEFTNFLYKQGKTAFAVDTLLLLMAPMAPHIAAELWERRRGEGADVHAQPWPEADPELAALPRETMVVQVNGKVRDRIEVAADVDAARAERLALGSERVQAALAGRSPTRVVTRLPRLVNLVVAG
jgi:leucyl-tRNA synthetase